MQSTPPPPVEVIDLEAAGSKKLRVKSMKETLTVSIEETAKSVRNPREGAVLLDLSLLGEKLDAVFSMYEEQALCAEKLSKSWSAIHSGAPIPPHPEDVPHCLSLAACAPKQSGAISIIPSSRPPRAWEAAE
mmetsp:Transcript_45843/g.146260  ORF Transcript_45843/g.146260 Transcript_45843/m.146260 type:complete len:132 (+) Transcript_45843:1136-1531(+)